ncbi:insulin receptor substrate 1 [Xenopus laevis]|uniref:Insulin receptor substrate 1 n=2 Tax=Xenopus laevis TaxID=8355 RepID=A0A1L8H482_XENLA|nr:insulin receptor substrate 1 [Xenopus laevis]XP_018109351.1 insulin receptor substrate 1 [Xenopus laevis]XP_018109352.1 insulin receptor substrate 1 [Xenopus laevis]OCT90907.1 hypothetical protein XELAEV_18019524mg [Xenopus laevis]
MEDIKKCGYLRKQKSMRKRFFVLRSPGSRGPGRLEYYENEKKFRLAEGSGGPRGTLNLEEAFSVNKRSDAKRRHLLVIYTRDGGLGMSADGEEEQEEWYQAILEVQAQGLALSSSPEAAAWPGPAFREVWQVSVRPRGLGQTRNLSGIYRLCLTERTLGLLRLRSENPSVTLQLMNVRRCGHSDNYFFVEVGRSAVTGPGELWMQVEDSVVAQNMHETILEAMKSLSEEFRPRTKSQSLSSTPISVPSRRHHPNPPPPSQVGFCRRSRTETPNESSPVPKPHSLSKDYSTQSTEEEEEEKGAQLETNEPSADYGSASSDEYGSSPSVVEPQAFPPPSPGPRETNYISMALYGRRSQVMDPISTNANVTEEEGGRVSVFQEEDNYAMMGRREPRQETGYMPMLPGSNKSQDYMAMTPTSISPPAHVEMAGYVMMSPLGSCSPETERLSWPPSQEVSAGSSDSHASDYMNMWPLSRSASSTPPPQEACLFSPGGPSRVPASYRSLPRSYKMEPLPSARTSCSSSSDSLEELSAGRNRRPLSISVDTWSTGILSGNYRRPPSPGEYVSIHFRAPQKKTSGKEAIDPPTEYISMEVQPSAVPNGDYTEMDFVPHGTLQPRVKMNNGENAFKPSMEKLLPALEKTPPEKDSWTVDKVLWPMTPKETSPNGKLAAGLLIESDVGRPEKVLAPKHSAEDSELKSLVCAVTGCSLNMGQDRASLMRLDAPVRKRHCPETIRPPAPCNGTRPMALEPGLNYIDLDLSKEAAGAIPAPMLVGPGAAPPPKTGSLGTAPNINTYASIDFHMSGELRRGSRDGTEC